LFRCRGIINLRPDIISGDKMIGGYTSQSRLMATQDLEIFRTRPFRAVLTCAVRSVKRVVPLVEESETAVSLCQRIVGLSYSFAAGSQIEPVQLTETLNALQAQSRPEKISITAQFARSAVGNLTKCTALGGHILLIADQSPRFLDRAVQQDRQPAFEAAESAFTAAWNATGAGPQSREQAPSFSSEEINIANAAFQKDLQTLATVEPAGEDWLGAPFDAGDRGQFGELWPLGVMPRWYGISEPVLTIISADNLDIKQISTIERPDVVCWHFGRYDGSKIEATKSTMAAITHYYLTNRVVPPVFVIYAPGLNEIMAHELISEGATVFRNTVGGRIPVNPDELVLATAVMMGGKEVHQHQNEFWQYAQRRNQGLLTMNSAEVVKRGISWDRDKEIAGSADQYRSIVDLLRPLKQRKNAESGWPIDL
jgi:hypothetical protein